MTHRQSTSEPVPTAVRHRRIRRRPWRRASCTCGLSWPCQDQTLITLARRMTPAAPAAPGWNTEPTTALPHIGQSALLTPGQASRAGNSRR
jgi:hypothetical protein